MTKLNCTVKNCYYNKESMCCRDGIKVGGTDATFLLSVTVDLKEQLM